MRSSTIYYIDYHLVLYDWYYPSRHIPGNLSKCSQHSQPKSNRTPQPNIHPHTSNRRIPRRLRRCGTVSRRCSLALIRRRSRGRRARARARGPGGGSGGREQARRIAVRDLLLLDAVASAVAGAVVVASVVSKVWLNCVFFFHIKTWEMYVSRLLVCSQRQSHSLGPQASTWAWMDLRQVSRMLEDLYSQLWP